MPAVRFIMHDKIACQMVRQGLGSISIVMCHSRVPSSLTVVLGWGIHHAAAPIEPYLPWKKDCSLAIHCLLISCSLLTDSSLSVELLWHGSWSSSGHISASTSLGQRRWPPLRLSHTYSAFHVQSVTAYTFMLIEPTR